ncbi:MAG: hypothetical protein IKD69_14850, partial [Solobacterium sp.]|nr:hypothetical protein [Solobacterium sp.]
MTAWKQFYRYEIPYETVADSTPDCRIEYEDVLEALRNFVAESASIRTIKEKWLYPLMHLDDEVGLKEAAGIDPSEDLDDALANSLDTVPFERKATLRLVLSYLYAQALDLLDSDCQSCIEIMENVLYNEGKPVSQWRLSDMQKVLFVCEFYESGRVDLADEA